MIDVDRFLEMPFDSFCEYVDTLNVGNIKILIDSFLIKMTVVLLEAEHSETKDFSIKEMVFFIKTNIQIVQRITDCVEYLKYKKKKLAIG